MINRKNLRKTFHDYLRNNLTTGFEYAQSVKTYEPKPSTPYVDMSITLGTPDIKLSAGAKEDARCFCQVDVYTPNSEYIFKHETNVDSYVALFNKGLNVTPEIGGQRVIINAVATSSSLKMDTHYVSAITINFTVIE